MENFSNIGKKNSNRPDEWKDFFDADLDPILYNLQDSTHITVKLFRRSLKTLILGSSVVSISLFKTLIRDFPKTIHQLTISDFQTKDKMNFSIIKKIIQPGVEKCLQQMEGAAGLLMYIKLIKFVKEAYIDFQTTPENRIRRAWWCVFFVRYWRNDLIKKQSGDRAAGKQKEISISLKNFITSNTFSGIEVNAHNLLAYLVKCRDLGMPHLFLPGLQQSQTCEGYFRRTRSMTSTFSTVVNFTVFDLLQRSKRSQAITELINELGEIYVFPRDEITSDHFIPDSLPDDNTISNIVLLAKQEAIEDLESIGKF
jgi:hypothetical protein